MSVFTGPQYPGAMFLHRQDKKAKAEERNAATKPERRRKARGRCVTGKRIIPTAKEAQAELVGTIIRANRGNAKRRECRAYQCPECGFWHLTSQPAPPPKEKRS